MAEPTAVNTTPEENAHNTSRSQVEPTYAEGVLAGASGHKITPGNSPITGLIIHNPDGSKITVRMDEYNGHSHLQNVMPELSENLASIKNWAQGGAYTYPEAHEARRKAGLLANTEDLRSSMFEAYQSIGATAEGTKFFTDNAKHVQEVSWVSPQPTQHPEEGWKSGELSGNVRYSTTEEQTHTILTNHRGVEQANYYKAQQQKGADHSSEADSESFNPVALVYREANAGRSEESSDILNRILQAKMDLHHESIAKQSQSMEIA